MKRPWDRHIVLVSERKENALASFTSRVTVAARAMALMELARDPSWTALELTLRHHRADPLRVARTRRRAVAERLAEERLQLAVAGEPESLREARHGGGLHGAGGGDVGDASDHHAGPVRLHVSGDGPELLRQRFVPGRDGREKRAHVCVARPRYPRVTGGTRRHCHLRLLLSLPGRPTHQIATTLPSFDDRVAASAISSARIPSSMPVRGAASSRSTAEKWTISSAYADRYRSRKKGSGGSMEIAPARCQLTSVGRWFPAASMPPDPSTSKRWS